MRGEPGRQDRRARNLLRPDRDEDGGGYGLRGSETDELGLNAGYRDGELWWRQARDDREWEVGASGGNQGKTNVDKGKATVIEM